MENIRNTGNPNWLLTTIFFICLCFFLYCENEKTKVKNVHLYKQKEQSEKMTKMYLDKNTALIPKIDSLKKENSKLLKQLHEIAKKDKNIIIKYNEKIKVINKFAVSDMQSYFNSNFGAGESSNTR